MSIFEAISIAISVVALTASFAALHIQYKNSYPKIKLEKISQVFRKEKEVYTLAYSEIAKELYLFAKFNIISLTPAKGSLSNCAIKYKGSPKIQALTEYDVNFLPDDIKPIYQDFKKSYKLFGNCFFIEPLSTDTVISAFKLNCKFLVSNYRCKIIATYYGDVKYKIKLPIKLYYYHFIKAFPDKKMGKEMLAKEYQEALIQSGFYEAIKNLRKTSPPNSPKR